MPAKERGWEASQQSHLSIFAYFRMGRSFRSLCPCFVTSCHSMSGFLVSLFISKVINQCKSSLALKAWMFTYSGLIFFLRNFLKEKNMTSILTALLKLLVTCFWFLKAPSSRETCRNINQKDVILLHQRIFKQFNAAAFTLSKWYPFKFPALNQD